MEDMSAGLQLDDLLDMDEGEGSELEDEEEDLIDDPLPSPLHLLSSGAISTATSTNSSLPNDDIALPYMFSGKPMSIKRGRGRPRREGDLLGKIIPKKQGLGVKLKRWKAIGYMRGFPKRVKGYDRSDYDFMSISSLSPHEDPGIALDSETGALMLPEKEKSLPVTPDDTPYPPVQWPGKVCAFCNLGERSQLGQRELLRLTCPEGFIPQRMMSQSALMQSPTDSLPERESGDKSPRGPVTCRRQKSFTKCRHPTLTSEYVDELTIIGYMEEPDVQNIFGSSGYFYVHKNCATWAHGVMCYDNLGLQNVGPIVLRSTSNKCSFCNHFGASLICKVEGCNKLYHFPCATASGAFQDIRTLSTFCSQHLVQVPLVCESAVCYTCKMHGDITNLMFCSSCGEHYHGTCVGLAQLPNVRAGWMCRKCRVCQVCRLIGDETKLMACEQCDKVYHAMCQRPIVTTIPKYGWKCKCCRVCGDCGSRTPGAGLSSRWHSHYTVCDSCYQQRNKGYSCPLCHRAYRAHAHREMVQCALCRKFVHGTCDPEADLMAYQHRKEAHPEYEYVCTICKNLTQQNRHIVVKRNSIDDGDSLSASQESLIDDAYELDAERVNNEDPIRTIGLGKGKPYSASKIAKKRLGLGTSVGGRPKGIGKGVPGKVGFMKRQRLTDFGRKRGHKSKMRGIFGVPGVGLQRPTSDGSKNDEEPGVENRLILCSAKDKFVLTQDICVMCGALGTDQEGCLISCVQCGQCYHPYCVNVKVTKVILQKGWRCLDCTVCEGCGQRNDESRLILCDECDISFHIYCMDPPLDYVPHGNWKCKWCAVCQVCGATDPGFNCCWMNSYCECGPCASHSACPCCSDPYNEGDLIIQCVQCERWLHASCDSIKTEVDAEKCAEEGYNCLLCRPRDVPPPHLLQSASPKPPTPSKSPDLKSHSNYYLDGVYLSESGYNLIKGLVHEQTVTRKKRKKFIAVQDKEAGIMATIESVVAGSSTSDGSLEDSAKLELVDIKEDPQDIYKEGMLWTKEDGPPPEGFTLFTMESGVTVLRRKRQRNLQKLGIGGFLVRVRGIRGTVDNDDVDMLPGQTTPTGIDPPISQPLIEGDKPRRKPVKRKVKTKLSDSFPSYLQEAFFGKELLERTKEPDNGSDSDDEGGKNSRDKEKTIQLSQDEIKAVAAVTAKHEKLNPDINKDLASKSSIAPVPIIPKEEDESDTEALKDVLALPGDLLDTDLVNTIMNEDDDELTKNAESLEVLTDSSLPAESDIANTLRNTNNRNKDTKDELTDILGSHFNMDSIPNINSKDVEDIFKNVLTDESQESQESSSFSASNSSTYPMGVLQHPLQHSISAPVRPTTLPAVNQNSINSPVSFPPQSPYHSEYSNSPQFSPAFSEPPSPWVTVNEQTEMDTTTTTVPSTYNQRSSEKMKADEGLGSGATISAVLYANTNHPEWKTDHPSWNDRYKQIIKKWRTLSTEQRAPYLQQARDNRSALRMKKQQQINKESTSSSSVSKTTSTPVSSTTSTPPSIMPAVSEDQEKITQQQKTAREAEQERQWKQLQALRQQQAQQQQNVLHEQRTQVVTSVQRSLSDGGQPFSTEQVGVLQVTSQQISPNPSSSPTSQFYPPNLKGTQVVSPSSNLPSNQIRVQQSLHNPAVSLQQQNDGGKPPQQSPLHAKLQSESVSHLTSTPRLQFTTPRPALQAYAQTIRPGEGPEINRQLRDLLQKQQFKKLDEQLLPGKGQQRVWPPNEGLQDVDQTHAISAPGDTTFRHPLPPGIARPRSAVSTTGMMLRQPGTVVGVRMPDPDTRMQNVDFRTRLILQQRGIAPINFQQQQQSQQQQQQPPPSPQFPGNIPRFPTITAQRPSNIEQYEQFLQKQAQVQASKQLELPSNVTTQANVVQRLATIPHPPPATTGTATNESSSTEQEIPDNVTAELEKLEQETGTIVELHGVSDILGGLGEDDDELLAEMGADFNILEYADPELNALTGGEKTNILDSLDLVEPEPDKDDKKDTKSSGPSKALVQTSAVITTHSSLITSGNVIIKNKPITVPSIIPSRSSLPPPLAVSQQQVITNTPPQNMSQPLTPQQQVHQQMLHQVQQAAAVGRTMALGTKLMSPDGVIGIVTPNNNVSLTFPPNYAQKILSSHMQLQNQKLQMRLNAVGEGPTRMPINETNSGTLQNAILSGLGGSRMNIAPPPPPPPPYPGPPPPYPGSTNNQNQEQPLLLEDLLEQEKREQEKQLQSQTSAGNQDAPPPPTGSSLLNDHDFEKLKADVFNSNNININDSTNQNTQRLLSSTPSPTANQPRPSFSVSNNANQWQQNQVRAKPVSTLQPAMESTPQIPTFNVTLLPAPPLPPENIVTEQDRQAQIVYEQWLNNQNAILSQQLKYYETEVQKLRKMRKSLNSKQRQLRKTGSQLAANDAMELQRISAEQAILQKHLESSRKQSRQHGMLIQEYRSKQQTKQRPGTAQVNLVTGQQSQSPLGPPNSSPIHHTPQSPMMSPTASPMMQHNSPLQSPRPVVSHSPSPSSVASIMHSPNNPPNNMSPMQPSPRIGTPHSQQSEGSPGPVKSPSQVCLPPPNPRITSPQHRRIVTSPVAYLPDVRPGLQQRFVRPGLDQQQRPRLSIPANFLQRPGTPSPINSPPQQIHLTQQQHQQLLQRQLQQQIFLQQNADGQQNEPNVLQSQRAMQLIQQRQLILRQQQLLQQQQQQQQAAIGQPQPLTPQQHQLMIQQQQQLAKQQQQQIAQLQAAQQQNNRMVSQSQPPTSPMPPCSPMINQGQQIMSPHSVHSQPASPMVGLNPPSSPMARSPAIQQNMNQPPNSPMLHHQHQSQVSSPLQNAIPSPMGMRRPPSTNSSPVMPDRPLSVENPGTPRTPYTPPSYIDNDHSGGGNPHNPNNPIPLVAAFGKYGYFKLGLRGGSPIWALGRGTKRIPTPSESKEEKPGPSDMSMGTAKIKKEPHLSKVSILKKKLPPKSALRSLAVSKVGSLVSSDYNEFDDSSCTPPVTPPPVASSSRAIQKTIGKRFPETIDTKEQVVIIDNSPDGKQLGCDDVMDYDDDNDSTVVSTEVSLNSVAQQPDADDIAVIETFSQSDMTDVISSPLESGQIGDEFLLFPGNMVVDISSSSRYSDKDEEEDEEYGSQILNVAIQSPTPSEEELIMQVQGLSSNQLLAVADTPDSPEQEEMNVDPSPSPEPYVSHTDEDILAHLDESEIVIIDPSVKSPEISTTEDFEKLIDEGTRKEKIMKQEMINTHITEIHKYAANLMNYPAKSSATSTASTSTPITITSVSRTTASKISFIPATMSGTVTVPVSSKINTSKIGSDVVLAAKIGNNTTSSNLTSIILPIKTTVSPSLTIVSACSSRLTIPVISASAISKLPNVKVIDKPSSSLSLAAHDACLPKKIFDDESSVSPDSSTCDDEKSKLDNLLDEKIKQEAMDKIEKTEENSSISLTASSNSPLITKIVSNAPELKMTAQIIQEKQRETISASFITTQDAADVNCDSDNDSKSVVISIPSPTPSQEQMLDNMALQALENRRRDGKSLSGEFDTFEDVLDMIENITGEPPTLIEANIKDKMKIEDTISKTVILKQEPKVEEPEKIMKEEPVEAMEVQTPVTVSTSARPTVMPQLSPLSQPADLTTNMANVSQQLRTLLSSLHTTTVTTSPNIATVVKSVTHKEKVMPNVSVSSTASLVTSRIIQPTGRLSPIATNTGVILPNLKQKTHLHVLTVTSAMTPTITTSVTVVTAACNKITTSTIQLMPDHPKLPPVTLVQSSNIPKTNLVATTKKSSLSLNAMLQSHPAATVAQTSPGIITTASILGSPVTINKTSFTPSLVHAQPLVISPNLTSQAQMVMSTSNIKPVSTIEVLTPTRPIVTTTNLLHSQLTKVTLLKPKQEESNVSIQPMSEDLIKKEDIKQEPMEEVPHKTDYTNSSCKYLSVQTPSRIEDSQNVLLKQLLQNTACATTQVMSSVSSTAVPISSSSNTTMTSAPSLPVVPNLEAQLARPVPPTPSSLLPPLLQNDNNHIQATKSISQKTTIVTRETSFVSKPMPQSLPIVTPTIQQLNMEIKKCLPPSRTPSHEDLPTTPKPTEVIPQVPPLHIKKETQLLSPPHMQLLTAHEVKKEFIDDSSQHSEVSDQSRPDVLHMKEEMDMLETVTEKITIDQKEELKKLKRRAYQQKRRQNQILNKEIAGQPKKRPRKSSKVEEDYDTYIDGILAQLRTLPPMIVQEPHLGRNFGICPVYGTGELLKLSLKTYDSRFGDLFGKYGNAIVPCYSDYYNSKPYGDIEPPPEKTTSSTQRGFYDQEFPLIKFDTDDDRKFELFCRDNDTPDSIVSSSSPECNLMEPYTKFLGLKLIDEDEDDEDEQPTKGRLSPIVPIIAPIPIRLKPVGPYLKDFTDQDKENVCKDYFVKSKFGSNQTAPLKDSGNVTVTLTLTSSAAEDIMGVLRDLANILHIPPPTSYQIVERTSTPPSQKLGLYRTKGKDGKEGVPIDIQSILNGAAKFCRHCDVVILNNMIRKKVSELPFLSKDTELLGDGDELFFCSTACYMQFAIMHRSPSISEDKAAAIVDHLCQKDKIETRDRNINEATVNRIINSLGKMGMNMKQETRRDVIEARPIKTEGNYTSRMEECDYRLRKHPNYDNIQQNVPAKIAKPSKYKFWSVGCLQPAVKCKRPTDKELMELLYRLGITVIPSKIPEDTRRCMFCQNIGDGVADGPARLLNFDVDKWVHLNCGLWSDGVYETVNGALMNLENAIQQSLVTTCVHCNKYGATIRCFKTRCSNIYHLPCAVKASCVFYKNKTIYCTSHVLKNEKDNELTTLSVSRRVYVNRDENRQVAAVMHHASDTNNLLRVGNLIFLNVGQILPHQLQNFHTANYIYPIGYKIVRFYWSMRRLNKRCRYVCSIHEVSGRPEFRILVQDPPEEDMEFRDYTPKGAWNRILESLALIRRESSCLQVFTRYLTGEDLFGLTEPAVVRVLESLPGIETLTDYKFKYGRNPLLELPLAINPSGAARTEPKLRNQLHWKRPHTQRTGSSVRPTFIPTAQGIGEAVCPYSKQFVHSKSSQYKKMKQEWRNNVFLARSKIQGLGLYAARDLEKHTMVIEYIGEIIRTELAETREKQYEAKNRGIYMFRLDEERVIDATLSGGLARYINHSCNPNCVAEIVEVDRDLRIIIFAKRRIQRGEELAYDYKFDIEDDQHKISCMCGAPNCRKWMN